MRHALPFAASALFLSLATGCSPGRPDAIPAGPADAMITASAQSSHVPRDLMVAIAHVEGGLRLAPVREVSGDDAVPVAGVLELRHGRYNSLARGAALTGASEDELARDLAKGTEAGARVLDDLARDLAVDRDHIEGWAPAVEELSGHLSMRQRMEYRARVFHLLRHGGTVLARGGEALVIPAHDEIPIELTVSPPGAEPQDNPEFAGATWFPTPSSNKWTPGRTTPITMIAIHDTEGGWDASVSTLQNDGGKSVHYIVDADGGKVGQFVHEGDTAWHAGNWYYNQHMIGIEHVGYASDDNYQTSMYVKSAELVNDIAVRNQMGKNNDGTELDRSVLVGHQEVPNGNAISEDSPPCPNSPGKCVKDNNYGGAGNHRDPGVNWEWCQYTEIIGHGASCKCNDAFSLYNCVHDLSEKVRCDNGNIDIVHCPGGCEVQALGVDDTCAPDPGTSSVSVSAAATGAGGGSTTAGAGGGGVGGGASSGGGASGRGGAGGSSASGDGSQDQHSGCSTSGGGAGEPLALGAIGLALAAALRRRRESRS